VSDIKFSDALTCNHCGNKAPMTIVSNYSRIRTHEHEGTPLVWDEGPLWETLECPACKGISFRCGYWHEHMHDETGPDYELLYPAKSKLIRGLPPEIAKSFEAAQKVKPIDTNAFAVLLGRVLDMVCIDKKAKGDSLFNRLKDLADKGIMPQQLADMAHQLRQLRNIGAHADLGDLTDSEIPILESLSNAILEYVYSAPALVQLVQSKIDALKGKKP